MNLLHARQAAADVAALLAPACERIEIAGSVRRERPDVKDVEIVLIPKRGGKPVWGEPLTAVSQFEALIDRLMRTHQLVPDPALKRLGPKYKRLLYIRGAIRLPVDLFIADADNFGNLLAIRTGNAEWSRLLVTPRSEGGLMPERTYQRDGYLWRSIPVDDEERIACPDEASFFAALGLPVVPPAERDADTARRLRKELVRA